MRCVGPAVTNISWSTVMSATELTISTASHLPSPSKYPVWATSLSHCPLVVRMPKKTKQYGWQCSECDKDPGVTPISATPQVDLEAPRSSRARGSQSRLGSLILSKILRQPSHLSSHQHFQATRKLRLWPRVSRWKLNINRARQLKLNRWKQQQLQWSP